MIAMGKSKTKREKNRHKINDKYKQCEGDEFFGFWLRVESTLEATNQKQKRKR